jgi:hypothetical protein
MNRPPYASGRYVVQRLIMRKLSQTSIDAPRAVMWLGVMEYRRKQDAIDAAEREETRATVTDKANLQVIHDNGKPPFMTYDIVQGSPFYAGSSA